MVHDPVVSHTGLNMNEAMNKDACILCSKCFTTEKEIKRRKSLFGNSCKNEFTYLDSLIRSQCVGLSGESLRSFGQKLFLCIKCQQDLLNCEKAQKQFNELSHNILSKVQCTLFRQPTAVVGQQSFAGVKRTYQQVVEDEAGPTVRDQPRIISTTLVNCFLE